MKKIWVALLLGVASIWAGAGQTQDKTAPKELLDRAVKAMGGEAKLAALKVLTLRTKGSYVLKDKAEVSFTDDWSMAEDRYRLELRAQSKGEQFQETWTSNGGVGWMWESLGDTTTRLPGEHHQYLSQVFYAVRLVHRLSALKGPPFELTPLEEVKIGPSMAVGLKVVQKDFPDVKLYFDKDTSLPLKSEVQLKEYDSQAGALGNSVTMAFIFSDYKEFDGLKHFAKVTLKRNDRMIYETVITEINPREKLDDELFGKP